MDEEKVIGIKVQVDKTNVDASFNQIEKQANAMSNNVSKSSNKTGQSFNNLGQRVKNAFKGVNISGLTSSMERVKTTVAKTMKQVKSNIQSSFSALNSSKLKMPTTNTSLPTSNPTDNSIPKQLALIDKLKLKIKQWGDQHKKTSNQIKNANKGLVTSFKSILSAIAPLVSIYAVFAGLKTAITNAMDAIETTSKFGAVFGSETREMSKWIKQLNSELGLSEVAMMDYTSTMYSMAKNLELTRNEAVQMSKDLSLLSQDMASFYNVDGQEAFNKLKSYMAGSTEVLYEYGVVATEVNLKQFALTQGITKSYSAMSQAEKSMLRYQFAMDKLSSASGDLARTLQSPANQSRLLRTNLESLSTALGKCFMPILTVVLPILNTFIQALTTTINAIANFIASVFSLFGVQVDFGSFGSGGLTSDLEGAESATGGISDDLANGADSAKEIKKSLSSLDEINILNDNSSSSSSSGSGSTGGGVAGGDIDLGVSDSVLDEAETKISAWAQKVANALQSVWSSLKSGWNSVGDYITTSLEKLKQAFSNLGKSIENFLVGCWNNGGEVLIYNIGRLAGAFTGLALDISGQVIDAVAKLFDHLNPDNNPNTRKFIDAMNRALEACQNFALSAGGWLKTFMDNGGQEFLNNMSDICVIIGTTLVDAVADGIQAITDFLNSAEGQETIKDFAGVLEDLSEKLEAVSLWVSDNIGWLTILGGVIVGITAGMKLGAKAIEGVSLAFQGWGWITGLVAVISGALTNLWNVVLIPVYNAVMAGLGVIAGFFGVSVGWIVVAIGVLIGAVVLLAANWDWLCEKAGELWQGLQTYWEYIKTTVVTKCTEIKDKAIEIWTKIKQTITDKVIEIKDSIVTKFTEAKESAIEKVTEIKDNIYQKFTDAYTNVASIFGKIKTKISEKIGEARDEVKKAIDKIKGFLDFEWSLPKLKLPKISISGKFSLDPISVPSFGISWHRKGGILPAGSNAIFGMNGNNLMAGGEISTGGEAILPLSDLFNEMRSMFSDQNQQLISNLSSSNDQPIEVILQVGDTQLGRVAINSINKLQRQSGRMLLDIDY